MPHLKPAQSSTGRDGAIHAGRKIAPVATEFLYGGYLVLAMAAAVLSWQRAPSSLFAVAVAIIVLTTLISLLTSAMARSRTWAAEVVLWAVLISAIVTVGLFISSSFLGGRHEVRSLRRGCFTPMRWRWCRAVNARSLSGRRATGRPIPQRSLLRTQEIVLGEFNTAVPVWTSDIT